MIFVMRIFFKQNRCFKLLVDFKYCKKKNCKKCRIVNLFVRLIHLIKTKQTARGSSTGNILLCWKRMCIFSLYIGLMATTWYQMIWAFPKMAIFLFKLSRWESFSALRHFAIFVINFLSYCLPYLFRLIQERLSGWHLASRSGPRTKIAFLLYLICSLAVIALFFRYDFCFGIFQLSNYDHSQGYRYNHELGRRYSHGRDIAAWSTSLCVCKGVCL